MKKKIIITFILYIIILILINIFYGFFYEDDINNIVDKIDFRKNYYSRKTVVQYYNSKMDTESLFFGNTMSLSLSNVSYEKKDGKLKFNIDFFLNDKSQLEKLCFILRVYNNNNVIYNSIVGNKMYVDNTDYLLYNHTLYNKLSLKNFNTDNLNDTQFSIKSYLIKNRKSVNVCLNIKENYEMTNYLYIEILDLIYQPTLDNSHKLFDSLGEVKFIVEI